MENPERHNLIFQNHYKPILSGPEHLGKAKEVREGHVRNIVIVHVGVLWHAIVGLQ